MLAFVAVKFLDAADCNLLLAAPVILKHLTERVSSQCQHFLYILVNQRPCLKVLGRCVVVLQPFLARLGVIS